VGHQDDRLGAIVDGMLDCRDGTNDALVVGDLFVLVEGDVEVDLSHRWLAYDCGPLVSQDLL
jgi:hypothetical protein